MLTPCCAGEVYRPNYAPWPPRVPPGSRLSTSRSWLEAASRRSTWPTQLPKSRSSPAGFSRGAPTLACPHLAQDGFRRADAARLLRACRGRCRIGRRFALAAVVPPCCASANLSPKPRRFRPPRRFLNTVFCPTGPPRERIRTRVAAASLVPRVRPPLPTAPRPGARSFLPRAVSRAGTKAQTPETLDDDDALVRRVRAHSGASGTGRPPLRQPSGVTAQQACPRRSRELHRVTGQARRSFRHVKRLARPLSKRSMRGSEPMFRLRTILLMWLARRARAPSAAPDAGSSTQRLSPDPLDAGSVGRLIVDTCDESCRSHLHPSQCRPPRTGKRPA